ncbi:TetR/AcrR family transcriptional regulator [Patulibacter sp.]|uniref:TetR/AcrR family transcriptional regulator n=1 Tax=Patulibacter sp. TaxID=1912859 RepID=UPI00271CAD9A|nr:TetR/AcrR family transcriptional regulator [Patulibacter sp.]MDO9407119.1 TetR/AcrR family transcriptional regulator [Patulibacter sp.]
MPQPAPGNPPRRADAARNRERILETARAAFADPGDDVSMAEIARRAEVGMATLYRNFPGRQELLEAVYVDDVDAVCEAAGALPDAPPGVALQAWLRRFFAFYRSKRHVGNALLARPDPDNAVVHQGRPRVLAAGRPLFDAARRAGAVRDGLGLEQLLEAVVMIARIDGDEAYTEPILSAFLDGIAPAPTGQAARIG